jgi:hypothetical protein
MLWFASRRGDGMEKTEALAERARLQKLLHAYDADRLTRQEERDRGELRRDGTPDRAGKVRARIARLDEVIKAIEDDERP